jgi:tetratricopeptide (TPR) repeat protein
MPDDRHAPEEIIRASELPPEKMSEETLKGSWERIKFWGKTAVAVFAGVPSAIFAAWLFVSLLVLTFHRHSIDLNAITVPETLSKAGFTSEVATQHLRDAIFTVQERAQTRMAKTGVDINQDLAGITIPQTGVSLQSVAIALRSLMPGWQHEVSGEFVQLENEMLLRLRLNGRVIFSETTNNANPSSADALLGNLQGGAFSVVEKSQPFVAAAALYADGKKSGDLSAADREADHIITFFPANDENVIWAINLKGLIAIDRGDYTQAEAFFRKLPQLPISHANLGNIYLRQQKLREAITEFQEAIRLDPKDARPHLDLGSLYHQHYNLEMAFVEYQTAIRLDPKFAGPHINLGGLYHQQHNLEKAIAEYQEAIRLDPMDAVPHNLLGDVYHQQHNLEKAIAEYQEAIRLDPKFALPHYNLGISLRDTAALSGTDAEKAKRLVDACRAFAEGKKLAPDEPDYPVRMHQIDALMNGQGHCPPTS